MDTCYAHIWEFRVRADAIEAFRELYGPQGGWVRLFQRAPGYLFTELHQDVHDSQRFLSIDRWCSKSDLAKCQERFASEWSALDEWGETLTESELLLGEFVFVTREDEMPAGKAP